MKRIRQDMTDYDMPSYVEEILTENYCKSFVRMSIVKESGNYSFSYKPAGLRRLDPQNMKLYDKLLLLRNLISMSENASDHLIGAENYLLEPELVYARGSSVDASSLKLLFYPDVKKLGFRYKIVLFADRILNKEIREEREMADRIRETSQSGDMNRLKMFLDKSMLRLENSMN